MREQYNLQLKKLKEEMIQMGQMVEQAIESSYNALVNGDVEKAKEIVKNDVDINDQERLIENLCIKLILQQQPVASDLREISSVLKMVTDLERIGDHAADISELTVYLSKIDVTIHRQYLDKMASETMEMVIHCVEAYVNRNLGAARGVIEADDVVDDLFVKVKDSLVKDIVADPSTAGAVLDLLLVAKYFERIGDHAVISANGSFTQFRETKFLSEKMRVWGCAETGCSPLNDSGHISIHIYVLSQKVKAGAVSLKPEIKSGVCSAVPVSFFAHFADAKRSVYLKSV